MLYSKEIIEAIAKAMRDAPPAEKRTTGLKKAEAIRALSADIAGMKRKGYTLAQVAEVLRDGGIEVSVPTLRSYLRRDAQKKKRVKRSRQITPSAPSEAAPSEAEETLGSSEEASP